VRLEIIVPPSREALFQYLDEGRGDLVAAGLTKTPEREQKYAFSAPYQFVNELLVVPAGDTTTRTLADLKGKKIAARKSSSYYQTLKDFQGELGFQIDVLPEDLETEDVLVEVGERKIAATLADSSIVQIELTYNDAIRSAGPVGDVKEVGWAMRENQHELKAAADGYLKQLYKSTIYNMTVAKYFTNAKQRRFGTRAARSDKAGGQLSPYDALVKKHARTWELDWRLVTSQIVPRVTLRSARPELGRRAGSDASDAADGTGAEGPQHRRPEQRNPRRRDVDGEVLGVVRQPRCSGEGSDTLRTRQLQLWPRPRTGRTRTGQGHGPQPEQVVRKRRAVDAPLEEAGHRQKGSATGSVTATSP
jgi:extracellular solute-binding protein (family 3)